MELDIVEIKEKAKAAFLAAYWRCVGVAFFVGLFTGGGVNGLKFSVILPNNSVWGGKSNNGSSTGEFVLEEIKIALRGGFSDIPEAAKEVFRIIGVFLTPFMIIMLAVTVIILLGILIYSIFVAAPLMVGGNNFFMRNATGIYGAEPEDMFEGFRNGHYLHVVGTMFLKNLFIWLWSILLLVPGIIKTYEYRMVPYLLIDHPEMSTGEVFRTSKEMMDGYKWKAFLMDLSFIGLYLLGLLTLGVLDIFYTIPYQYNANAQLYVALAGRSNYEYTAQQIADIFDRANRF